MLLCARGEHEFSESPGELTARQRAASASIQSVQHAVEPSFGHISFKLCTCTRIRGAGAGLDPRAGNRATLQPYFLFATCSSSRRACEYPSASASRRAGQGGGGAQGLADQQQQRSGWTGLPACLPSPMPLRLVCDTVAAQSISNCQTAAILIVCIWGPGRRIEWNK